MSESNSITDTDTDSDTKSVVTKYVVPVKLTDKTMRLSEDIKNELKSIGMMDDKGKLKLKGVSPKMLKRMKMEFVDCPVLEKEISFIPCYVCKNFHSRVSGKVYCRGEPF